MGNRNPDPLRDGETVAQRRARQDQEHRAKVRRLEDEAILAGRGQDPEDKSDRANYLREVADDIVQRRAGDN